MTRPILDQANNTSPFVDNMANTDNQSTDYVPLAGCLGIHAIVPVELTVQLNTTATAECLVRVLSGASRPHWAGTSPDSHTAAAWRSPARSTNRLRGMICPHGLITIPWRRSLSYVIGREAYRSHW